MDVLRMGLTLLAEKYPGIPVDVMTSDDQASGVSAIPGVSKIWSYPRGPLADSSRREAAVHTIDRSFIYTSVYYLAPHRPMISGYRHIRRLTSSIPAVRRGVIYDCGYRMIDNLTFVRKIYEWLKDRWATAGAFIRVLLFAARQRGLTG